MEENSYVACGVTVEWQNKQGITTKKISYKSATLRLIRNEIRQLLIEISTEKATPIKIAVNGINVHKKFMTEGKATFKFPDCTIYLSNAPPGILIAFLKTLFVKMTGEKNMTQSDTQKKLRAHFLSEKPSTFEEVSPVTNAELMRAKKLALSKATMTTPSPPQKKRRGSDQAQGGPVAKKLYVKTPSIENAQILTLNAEQDEILRMCMQGRNIFFTGSAGTGKSFLLRKIISTFPPDGTVSTASTGVAACLIGGITLHSFAGIGAGDAGLKRCYELASRPASSMAWRKCKRLIIDEISMVDGEFFEKIEAVARYIRNNDKPFGGIQLILCGDFLQLPPVVKADKSFKRFCFQSAAWEKCIEQSYELKQVHRQKDPEFVKILNCIRIGRVTDDITDRLLQTASQKVELNGILATQLCSHTSDADSINNSKLENLKSEPKVFQAEDSDLQSTRQLDSQVPAPGRLVLKIGAQVMLLKNINVNDGLVNGARGVVLKYSDGYPVIRFKSNKEYLAKPEKWSIKTLSGTITRKQVPLKLAWAFSIHKSQGLTLDCVEMSLSKVFEAGQAYVALSRAQSLDSLRILDFDAKQVWANTDVLKYYQNFRRQLHQSMTQMIPLGRKKDAGDSKARLKKALSNLSKNVMAKPLVSNS